MYKERQNIEVYSFIFLYVLCFSYFTLVDKHIKSMLKYIATIVGFVFVIFIGQLPEQLILFPKIDTKVKTTA